METAAGNWRKFLVRGYRDLPFKFGQSGKFFLVKILFFQSVYVNNDVPQVQCKALTLGLFTSLYFLAILFTILLVFKRNFD